MDAGFSYAMLVLCDTIPVDLLLKESLQLK